ncbi:MAG: NUDIX domain-containing protein, partial [Bacteroidota bacterium]
MEVIKKVAWILIRDGQILSTLSKGKDIYYIPGGKKEAGESDEETLIREIKEELSVDIISSSIQYLETFLNQAHDKPAGVLVEMICYTSDYQGDLKADSEIEKFIWLEYKDRSQVAP